MGRTKLKGEALKEVADSLLGRHVSGEELTEIAYLFDSAPGNVSDRAVVAIRNFAQRDPKDLNAFFTHQGSLHQEVNDMESRLRG